MKIAITAASGLVGGALATQLEADGHAVLRVVRRVAGPAEIAWDPASSSIDYKKLRGIDGIVHLSGEPIADGRWTPERKKRILESRVQSTRFLCETLAAMEAPPKVLVCASAIGYYGDRGEERLDEDSTVGAGFLAEVCQAWEAACAPARAAGIRVVHIRIGIVLSSRGGALKSMLVPFRLGLGGRLGDGKAYMSWIALPDLVGAITHALTHDDLSGPVNGVAPNPVRNSEFTTALGHALGRPTVFPVPAFVIRAAMGEMGPALLLASTQAFPKALLASGYTFKHPTLPEALAAVLAEG